MEELYVNDIDQERGYTLGLAALNKTVVENLKTMYNADKMAELGHLFMNNPDGTYFFDRFRQFIVFLQYSDQQGLTMTISDYNFSVRNAIDEYMQWAESEWKETDIAQITKLFRDMEKDPNKSTMARMVIKDQL